MYYAIIYSPVRLLSLCAMASILCLFLIFFLCINNLSAQDTSCAIIWHEPVVLANEIGVPKVAAQGETLHVTWFSNFHNISYLRSISAGTEWETARNLFSDTMHLVDKRWIVADESSVYLLWRDIDMNNGKESPSWRASYDRGATWDTVKRIIFPYGVGITNDVAMYSDTVCVNAQINTATGGDLPRIIRIFNNGAGWNVSSESLYSFDSRMAMTKGVVHLAVDPLDSQSVIYYKRSTNLGDTWSNMQQISTSNGNVAGHPSISAEGKEIYVSWVDNKYGCASNASGCSILGRKSKDGGEMWLEENLLSDIATGTIPNPIVKNNIVAIAWREDYYNYRLNRAKVRISLDEGNSWCPVFSFGYGTGTNVAITRNAIHVFYTNEDSAKLYYVRGEILTSAIGSESVAVLAKQIELQQNYPNPFNPRTVISFRQLAVSHITLKVYDIFGKEVATLITNKQFEAGKHTVEWNAEGFTSGMYFYRLSVTNNKNITSVITKKMILMK